MDKRQEEYERAVQIAHKIYDLFDEEDLTIPQGMTILVMMLLSIAEEAGLSTETLVTGIRRQQELHNAIQNPHSTVQ